MLRVLGMTAHIEKLVDIFNKIHPRQCVNSSSSRISGIETLILDDDDGPYIVGELNE